MSGRAVELTLSRPVEAVTVVAQSRPLTERALNGAAAILGLALIAAGVAAVVALLYRWYVRERVPGGLPTLFGLSAVVPLLRTQRILQELITPTGNGDPLDAATALSHIVAVVVWLFATRVGTDIGDRIGSDLTVATGERAVETEVSRVVQAVGRVITVELPKEVEDIVGYDPVPDETKEALAGTTFVFPRRLTVDELRDRLVARLKADYAVGHVDVELADDGTVEFLAVGSRAAGIGPTLPPETSAVAVQADPAFAASAGDLVQVWDTDPFERVLTAEVRGTVDDVVTLAVDAADTRKLDAETHYKLATLPVESRPDREFASVLRAADETMAAVTVADASPLAGQPVGALDVTVVAIRPGEGPVEPLPARDRLLAAADALYLVAAPEAIRKVEQAASPSTREPTAGSTTPSAGNGARIGSDEQVDATTPAAGKSADDSTREADGTAPETDTPSEIDDLSDADAPGIQALESDEPDEVADGEQPVDVDSSDAAPDDVSLDEASAGDDSPDEEPTRADLADFAGVDVDDLTGADVSVDANGEPDESLDESRAKAGASDGPATDADEAQTVDPGATETADEEDDDRDGSDGIDVGGRDSRASSDDDGTDDDGADDDADEGWTVAVDERRDDSDS